MRIFEIVLLLVCTLFPVYITSKHYLLNKRVIIIALLGIIAAHLALEGYRWQMIPAYCYILLLLFVMLKNFSFFKGSLIRKIGTGLPYLAGLILAWALPYFFPIFEFPLPSGQYRVGSQYIHIKSTLDETITSKPSDFRELMVKVWYPCKAQNEALDPYLNIGERQGFAEKYGLPKNSFNYLNHVQTNTLSNAEVANGTFPVLIFSPGYYSNASGYYALLEDIVSQGYIVLNINHTYENTGSLFPDGTIRFYNKDYNNLHNEEKMAEMAWNASENYSIAKNEDEQFKAVEELMRNYIAVDITKRWSRDISLVIDELENLNTNSFLSQSLDISNIGVFGHSQGGAATGEAVLNDSRIKAGINIDGVQWGSMLDNRLTKPFMLLSSDWEESHMNLNKFAYRNGSTNDFYSATIAESGHSNFMDIPLMIRIPQLNEAGSINPHKAHRISSIVVRQFFNKYLKKESTDILELNTQIEALTIESIKN